MEFKPNKGKSLYINVHGRTYARYPIRTHLIREGEDIAEVVRNYTKAYLRDGDVIFVSEKVVAISQGRAYPIESIKPSLLARILSRFVSKSPYGIGLGMPQTMELAIREVGIFRILLASFLSALTKPLGIKGVFYRVAGGNVNAIDGPTPYTIPPYNRYAKLPPKEPDKVARRISLLVGVPVIIVDANDIGVEILGTSHDIDRSWAKEVFRDNPLGQSREQTPICIVREVEKG